MREAPPTAGVRGVLPPALVRPSVRTPYVCPSHAGTVSKRLKLQSCSEWERCKLPSGVLF